MFLWQFHPEIPFKIFTDEMLYHWFASKWSGVGGERWDKVLEKEVGRGIEKNRLALSS